MSLAYNHHFKDSYLGWQFLVRGQRFTTQSEAMAASGAAVYAGNDWKVQSEAWQMGGLMLGLFADLPLSAQTSFNLKAHMGLMGAQLPAYRLTVVNGSERTTYIRTEATESAIGYLLGLGFRTALGPSTFLLFNLDYQGANFRFTEVEYKEGAVPTALEPLEVAFSAVTLNVGLAAQF